MLEGKQAGAVHGLAASPDRSLPAAAACAPQEKEVEARKASLSKWKLDLLHRLMDVLDLQRGSGDKVRRRQGARLQPACRLLAAALVWGDG